MPECKPIHAMAGALSASTGSGKKAVPTAATLTAFLTRQYGRLVLCPKPEEERQVGGRANA